MEEKNKRDMMDDLFVVAVCIIFLGLAASTIWYFIYLSNLESKQRLLEWRATPITATNQESSATSN